MSARTLMRMLPLLSLGACAARPPLGMPVYAVQATVAPAEDPQVVQLRTQLAAARDSFLLLQRRTEDEVRALRRQRDSVAERLAARDSSVDYARSTQCMVRYQTAITECEFLWREAPSRSRMGGRATCLAQKGWGPGGRTC